MECLIGMAFDDFVMVAADQTNARWKMIFILFMISCPKKAKPQIIL